MGSYAVIKQNVSTDTDNNMAELENMLSDMELYLN